MYLINQILGLRKNEVELLNKLTLKLCRLKSYKTETKKYPFSRSIVSIKNLAMYRGAQSGCDYAEAFKIIRIVKKIS